MPYHARNYSLCFTFIVQFQACSQWLIQMILILIMKYVWLHIQNKVFWGGFLSQTGVV